MQNVKIKVKQSRYKVLNYLITVILFLGIIAMMVANYHFSLMDPPLKATLNLLFIIALLGLSSFTQKGRHFWSFAREAKNELTRVIWPKKRQVIHTTLIIFFIVIVASLFLWLIDGVLFSIITFLTTQRG